jgi:hypothetical protein
MIDLHQFSIMDELILAKASMPYILNNMMQVPNWA